MSGKWVTVDEAAVIFRVSTSTIRRRMENEKIESKLEDGRRLVWVSDDTQMSSKDEQLITELRTQNEHLRGQVEELQKQLAEASGRHDTIVLQLTRQLEQSQRLLEYHQEPWYRRWFKKRKQNIE